VQKPNQTLLIHYGIFPSISTLKEYNLKKDNAVMNLICYCFGFSADDIKNDYLENDKSTILEKIQREKRFGNCQCATKNPKGK